MTHAQQNLLVGGLVGLAIGAGAALLFWTMRGSYEDGIRVKNGSLYIHTVGGFELDPAKGKYKTKKSTKGCYNVAVTRGGCADDFYADGAAKVTFTSGIDGISHVVIDEGSWTKKFHLDKGKWNLTDGATRLIYADPNAYLSELKAFDKQDNLILSCTGHATAKMEAHLSPTDC